MPEIEITPEQQERLRALQEDIARDVVGKYGHVRPRDAVEYLLDRYEEDDERPDGTAVAGDAEVEVEADDAASTDEDDAPAGDATARVVTEESNGDATDGASDDGDDAMLNEMMSLLDTHEDKWGESSGDERYEVELPDGETEQVRTKDDVKALLFKHYR